MKMISAKEANAKTFEIISSCITNELSEIMNNIQNKIDEGCFCYSNGGYLHEVTKKRLEELGYEVKTGAQYNEPYYYISWENV